MKIAQVLDYYNSGNAVANIALNFYKFTKRLNVQSNIVARLIDKKDEYIEPLDILRDLSDEDVIMYHLCIGTPLNNEVCLYKGIKVLVYHNITPPDLLVDFDEPIAEACNDGLLELKDNLSFFDYSICDSEFNKSDLVNLGFDESKIFVIPPLISSSDFKKEPSSHILKKYNDGKTNFLFVGRLSPHKKQDDLIKFFSYYKKKFNQNSRLILAGNGSQKYIDYLENLISELSVDDVVLTRQIPFADLLAYYKTADFFVCMSEHEGYGMPLIEAMHFNIPVIAYNSSAISDTLRGGGVLLNSKEPEFVSKVIENLRTDSVFKAKVLEKQAQVLSELTEEKIFARFSKVIDLLKKNIQFSKQRNVYDVVIAIKAADWDVLKVNLTFIKRNLKPKRIIVVSQKGLKEKVHHFQDISFIDEDSLFPELNFAHIKELLFKNGVDEKLAGWYLQQFLKLSYSFVCKDEYYLTWDADSIPLNEINMVDEKTGNPFFDMKPEFVEPYFSTIRNLFSLEKKEPESFIAEHMLFKTSIVQEMLNSIKTNEKSFFEVIIEKTDFSKIDHSFSEFETYGTYCDYNYPKLYTKRHLRTFRAGKMFLGATPSYSTLTWVSKCIDIVSFEFPQQVNIIAEELSKNINFRNDYCFTDFVKNIVFFDNILDNGIFNSEDAAVKMDYPFSKNARYIKETPTLRLNLIAGFEKASNEQSVKTEPAEPCNFKTRIKQSLFFECLRAITPSFIRKFLKRVYRAIKR